MPITTRAIGRYDDLDLVGGEYVPFPAMERRDSWQAKIEIPFILQTLGIPQGQRILEVGCGRANALVPLAARCAPRRLVGLDVDRGLLEEARRHLEASGIAAELPWSAVPVLVPERHAFLFASRIRS